MGDLGQVKLWCDAEWKGWETYFKCYVEIPDKQIWRREITDVMLVIQIAAGGIGALTAAAFGFGMVTAGATSIATVYGIICASTLIGCLG